MKTLTETSGHSELHMNGLERMVETQGGLHCLPNRLRRTLSMIEILFATTWNRRPRFPFVHSQKELMSTLESFPSLANFDLNIQNLRQQIGICLRVSEALQVLRVLTVVRSANLVSKFDRLALSDAIYILEWQLLPTYGPSAELVKADFSIEMNKASRISAFLYIDIILREMHSINIVGWLHRFIEMLQGILDDCFQELMGNSGNELVLWILFIGGVASKSSGVRGYFVNALGCICRARKFQCCIEFEEAVDKVGPGLQAFREQSAEMWTEISLLEGELGEVLYIPV